MNADFAILLNKMRDDFVAELPERCDSLEECVLNFERGREGAFNDLYRTIHSLKGSGSTFGLSIITSICHQFESFIVNSSRHVDALTISFSLSYVDLLRRVSDTIGHESASTHDIEKDLEQLRVESMPGRASVLLLEPSTSTRKFCQGVLDSLSVRTVTQERGLSALEQLLHEPFDLLVAARELPDLNTVAIVAALRESNSRNKNIPVILVSSNLTPVPDYLNINAVIARDAQFIPTLAQKAGDLLKHK